MVTLSRPVSSQPSDQDNDLTFGKGKAFAKSKGFSRLENPKNQSVSLVDSYEEGA